MKSLLCPSPRPSILHELPQSTLMAALHCLDDNYSHFTDEETGTHGGKWLVQGHAIMNEEPR